MNAVRFDRKMMMLAFGRSRLIDVGTGEIAARLGTRLVHAKLRQRILWPAALTGYPLLRRRPLRLLLAKLTRRQPEAMAEGAAEMRGIAKTIGVGDLRDRAMRLGRIGQVGPGALQPPLAHVVSKVVADRLEQLLQIALGDSFGLRDARGHQLGIVEAAFDALADPVQECRLRCARSGVGRRSRQLMGEC